MKQGEKFEVAVATFEAFLKRKNAHAIYFQEWGKKHDYKGTANVFYAWREWAKDIDPSVWVNGAFTWTTTNHGLDFWDSLHRMWKRHLKNNLNK